MNLSRKSSGTRNNLEHIFRDGAYYSLMIGLGESYLAAYALHAGHSDARAGLLATWPILVGSFLQLATLFLVRQGSSSRNWIRTCALLQALCFLPLVLSALWGWTSFGFLLIVTSLYWSFSLSTAPVWFPWVEPLIPRRLRAIFFARRSLWCYACILASFLGGGLVLEGASALGQVSLGYAIIFSLAMFARLISRRELGLHPDAGVLGGTRLPATQSLRRMFSGKKGLFILYMLSTTFAVQFSAPFFTPYMFRQLEVGYLGYVALLVAAISARILVLPWQGRLARRFGVSRLLWWGGLSIVPMSVLWVLSNNMIYLFSLQFLSGIAWSAFELATFLLLFEAVPAVERRGFIALFTFLNAAMISAGASIGGWVLEHYGSDLDAYHRIFTISSVLRCLPLLLLYKLRNLSSSSVVPSVRPTAVRPSAGILPQLNPGSSEPEPARTATARKSGDF